MKKYNIKANASGYVDIDITANSEREALDLFQDLCIDASYVECFDVDYKEIEINEI